MNSKNEYYNSLPRKRGAVGVIFLNEDRILILEPTYKKNWLVPGGVIEKFESPLEAAIRECKEEIGVDVRIASLLCADYKRGNEDIGDAVHYLFFGEILNRQEMRLNQEEIKSLKWASPDQALMLFDEHLSKRVEAGLQSIKSGKVFYCEEGKIVF